VISTSGRSW